MEKEEVVRALTQALLEASRDFHQVISERGDDSSQVTKACVDISLFQAIIMPLFCEKLGIGLSPKEWEVYLAEALSNKCKVRGEEND